MKSAAKKWLPLSLILGVMLSCSTLFAKDLEPQPLSFQAGLEDNLSFQPSLYVGRNKSLSEQFELGLTYDVLKSQKAQIGIGVNAGFPANDALQQDLELGSSLFGIYQIRSGLDLGVEGAVNYHRLESSNLQNSTLDVESSEVRYDITLSLQPAQLFNKPAFRNIYVKAGVSDSLLADDSLSLKETASTNKTFDLGDDTKFYLDFDYRY